MITLIDSFAHDVNLSPGTLHVGGDIEPGLFIPSSMNCYLVYSLLCKSID